MKKFYIYHLPLISYLLFIFVMSSLPGDSITDITLDVSDKLIHAGVYFLLFFLFQHSLHNQDKFPFIKEHAFLFSFLFTVIYGASDEFHQYFVPTRESDMYDLVADAVGGLVAFFIAKTIMYFKSSREINPD